MQTRLQQQLLAILQRVLLWRPRLLPMMIISAAMLLTVRVSHLFNGRHLEALQIGGQSVEASPTQPEKTPLPKPEETKKEEKKEEKTDEKKEPSADTKKEEKNEDKKTGGKEEKEVKKEENGDKKNDEKEKKDKDFDPLNMTPKEAELFSELAKRRKGIQQKEEQIKTSQATVALVEKKMGDKIKELKSLEEKINAHIKNYDEQAEKNMLQLAKIYEQMKPASAAKVFNEMNVGIIVEILMRMNPGKVPAILQLVEAEKAKEISTLIASHKPLFKPTTTVNSPKTPSTSPTAPASNAQAPKPPAPKEGG